MFFYKTIVVYPFVNFEKNKILKVFHKLTIVMLFPKWNILA